MTQSREGVRHCHCVVLNCVRTRYCIFVGRLDWIRTNDPHHVKVVL